MKPGATTMPAGVEPDVARAGSVPISTMRPPSINTSACDPGAPVPSTTVPPRTTVVPLIATSWVGPSVPPGVLTR